MKGESAEMAYKFQEVNIYLFDVHSVPKVLSNPNCVQKAFNFLVDEAQYTSQYDLGNAINTANLSIRPLTKRSIDRNHFWKRYKDIMIVDGKPDYWKLQIPFLCAPTSMKVKLGTGRLGFQANVRSAIYLSGMGWSSNLHIHLSGDIDAAQLIDFIDRLNTKNNTFLVSGKPKGVVGIFQLFADWIRSEVYSPTYAPVDRESCSKYLVTSIVKFQGSLNYYKSSSGSQPQMSDLDRSIMLSILRGSHKDLKDWARETNDKKFTVTEPRDRPDFGLVDFERSALIFMQDAASKHTQGKLRCHGSNSRLCYMMVFSLLALYNGLEAAALTNPKLATLRNSLKASLRELPLAYTNNMLCQALYSNHNQLQKLTA